MDRITPELIPGAKLMCDHNLGMRDFVLSTQKPFVLLFQLVKGENWMLSKSSTQKKNRRSHLACHHLYQVHSVHIQKTSLKAKQVNSKWSK